MIEIERREAMKHNAKIVKSIHGTCVAIIEGVEFRMIEDKPIEDVIDGNEPESIESTTN